MKPAKTESVDKSQELTYVASKLFKVANLSICLFVVALVFFIAHLNLLERIELFTLDLRYKLRGELKSDPNIIFIDIDESSLKAIGRWPWSREWHASLITTLVEYNAKIIALDIFFSEPSPLVDFFLIEATRLAKNVFYALAFEYAEEKTSPKELEEEKVLERFAFPKSQITGNKNYIPKLPGFIPPLVPLYSIARGAGNVDVFPDKDGIIRRVPAIINCRDKYFLHFAIEIAIDYLGLDRNNVKIVLGKYIDLGPTTKGHIKIPIDGKGLFLVNWVGPWEKVFKHYSFWQVVSSYQKLLEGEEPLINLKELNEKICLTGLTATGLIRDLKPIPIQTEYPMVGLHANVLDNIIQNRFIKETQPPVTLLVILLLSCLIGVTVYRFRPVGGFLFTVGLIIIYLLIAFLLFKFLGVSINIIYPLTGVTLSFALVTVHTEVANAIERARLYNLAVEDGLTKLYVVRHFKEILSTEMAKAGRYNRPLSLIISDIDHFKRVNDSYGHLAGDFILRETANIFKSSCREGDVAGRYGGEEFIILLPETDRAGAVEFAERLRKLIEGLTLEYNNIKFNITISFGVADFKGETNPVDFIKRVDEALYVAKETGRNKVCFS